MRLLGFGKCESCETLRELLREERKVNRDLVVLIKDNQDFLAGQSNELLDSITGKNRRPQTPPTNPVPSVSRRAKLAALARRDREEHIHNRRKTAKKIDQAEKDAGIN